MRDNRKARSLTPIIAVALFLAGLAALAGSFVLTTERLASFARDGEISASSAYYIWIIRAVLVNAGAIAVLAAVACILDVRAKPECRPVAEETRNQGGDLFVASFLILFMELALIRWIPAYVKLMAYFTNFILLAAMLGMGLGCLATSAKRKFIKASPFLLAVVVVVALMIYGMGNLNALSYSLAHFGGRDYIYFGGEGHEGPGKLVNLGITTVMSIIFVLVTMIFIGPGQVMGRLFDRFDNPVAAYSINVGAGVAGIVCFSALSFVAAPAWVWFVPIAAMLFWLLIRNAGRSSVVYAAASLLALSGIVAANSGAGTCRNIWSPYYRIFYSYPGITVNEIGHQTMQSGRDGTSPYTYNLPYVTSRDAAGRKYDDILIIGAGSGNDVSHALIYGAKSVDAVEIDPAIIGIGRKDHPDHPYDDSRVHVYNDDGRSFLRRTDRKYDMIVYGLVDSLTLMSNFSSVRLENYLFTKEAFADVKKHLKPGGVFVMYNYFRWNWLTVRLAKMLEEVYGEPPILIILPPVSEIGDKEESGAAMSILMAGDVGTVREAFARAGEYKVPDEGMVHKYDFNGFNPPAGRKLAPVYSTRMKLSEKPYIPTDNWPFVYLRKPAVPVQNIWGLLAVAATAVVFVGFFTGFGGLRCISAHYFFLGGAFMLLETESIVKLALIHGSTWFVNSVVFVSVLLMILIANLLMLKRPVKNIMPVYILLFASLAANYFLPVEVYLGKSWFVENVLSGLMMFVPIGIAGIIFASSYRGSKRPALDLGSNLLGVIAGGIVEYSSLAFGYNTLLAFAAAMYLISLIALPRKVG